MATNGSCQAKTSQANNGTTLVQHVTWWRSNAANIGSGASSWNSVSHSHPVMYKPAVPSGTSLAGQIAALQTAQGMLAGMWWTRVLDGAGVLAFRNEQTSVSVAGGRLQLVFVAKRPPAGTNLFKSCNCSSLTNKLKKTKMEHKLTFIRSLFCVWVKKNFYRSKCFLFDSCLTHTFIFDCTHTDLPWSSFVCFANTLTFKKIVL